MTDGQADRRLPPVPTTRTGHRTSVPNRIRTNNRVDVGSTGLLGDDEAPELPGVVEAVTGTWTGKSPHRISLLAVHSVDNPVFTLAHG